MEKLLNGFNNGRDKSDGVGGKPVRQSNNMEKQTALMQLKEKLQTVVDELKDSEPGTDQYGYRSAMENVIKDIDANMLPLEKQQIVEAVWFGHDNKPDIIHVPESFGEDYFESTYKTNI